MGNYIELAPTISSVIAEEEFVSKVDTEMQKVSQASSVVASQKEITKEKVNVCLLYFIWWRASVYPNDMSDYIGKTYREIGEIVDLSEEQVKQLHEEFIVANNEIVIASKAKVGEGILSEGDVGGKGLQIG